MLKEFCLESVKEGDHVEGLCIDRVIMLKSFLRKWNERNFSGFVWLRRETSGGFL
jgi:hypothetical protein